MPGFYLADVTVSRPGNWMILARDSGQGERVAGLAAMPVTATPVAAIGSKALSMPTPVATTPEEAAKIDTRDPPAPMHYISLDAALRNGLPTIIVFATALLCQSRRAAPWWTRSSASTSESAGNEPISSMSRSTRSATPASLPEFLRWGFDSEPWVLVIDRDGIIRGRFEGPSVASEIEDALRTLLPAP